MTNAVKPVTILLVPHPEHAGLLEGEHGARPPTRHAPGKCLDCGGPVGTTRKPEWMGWGQYVEQDFCKACSDDTTKTGFRYFSPSSTRPKALLLAHEGRAVAAGCDACDWALNFQDKGLRRYTWPRVEQFLSLWGAPSDIRWDRRDLGRLLAPIGTVLCLDATGQEIA